MQESKAIIIVSMHRSGSSLTANWLQECGLFIGHNLLENCPDNVKGHFEDLDFLRLHQEILRDNKLDYRVDKEVDLKISEEHKSKAQLILEDRKKMKEWGWKEPRTCLFLDFWLEHIPNAKVLFIYRHYNDVVDSLLRRELLHPHQNTFWNRQKYSYKNRWLVKKLIRVWNHYNNEVLKVIESGKADFLVFEINDIIENSKKIANNINTKWDFHLNSIDISTLFEEKLMNSGKKKHEKRDLSNIAPKESEVILKKLEQYRNECIMQLSQTEQG